MTFRKGCMAWHWNMHTRPSCVFFWGETYTVGATKNGQIAADDLLYIFHISFLRRSFPPYFLDEIPPLPARFVRLPISNTAVRGASNLHGEGSTSTLLSLAPRTAESTSGRDCDTRGHDLLADCSMSFCRRSVFCCQFPRAGKRRGFSMLRRIHAFAMNLRIGSSTRTTLLRRVKHQDLRWTLEFLKFRDILLHPFFPSVDRSTSDAVDPLKKA